MIQQLFLPACFSFIACNTGLPFFLEHVQLILPSGSSYFPLGGYSPQIFLCPFSSFTHRLKYQLLGGVLPDHLNWAAPPDI